MFWVVPYIHVCRNIAKQDGAVADCKGDGVADAVSETVLKRPMASLDQESAAISISFMVYDILIV